MKRRDWDTNCARKCEKVHRSRVSGNTDLVVRETKLLAPTSSHTALTKTATDREHFRIQFDVQLT